MTLRARQQLARREVAEALIAKLGVSETDARELRSKVEVKPAIVNGYWPQQRTPQRETRDATDRSLRTLTIGPV